MNNFFVLKQLLIKNGKLQCLAGQRVHYRQGDLDGACGAYSTAIALRIIGIFNPDRLNDDSVSFDKRTLEWKIAKEMNGYGLYQDGLYKDEVKSLLDNYKSKIVVEDFEDSPDCNNDIIAFIQSNIEQESPIILRISYSGGGHFTTVVGYQCDSKGRVVKLLTLDPAYPSPTVCMWNGVIDMKRIPKKRYNYFYETMNTNIKLEDAISIHPK